MPNIDQDLSKRIDPCHDVLYNYLSLDAEIGEIQERFL